ncbi:MULTISPECIES: AAA family ATPase [unclassified Mesorhizobium]|uniref:AAA family ATPase n=1 Tax=unclassified Mesorhizobium TaxID=325217 RepID=UPI00301446A6
MVGTSDRILIMGNGGSGKTWLAGSLAEISQHPVIHLDDMHWEPGHYGIAREREFRDKLVMEAAAAERWIMEGVYGQLVNMVLFRVTVLIWLDLPEEECIANAQRRGIQGGGSETRFQDLLKWIAEYRARKNNWNSFEAHAKLFDAYPGPKLRPRNRPEIATYLDAVSAQGGN